MVLFVRLVRDALKSSNAIVLVRRCHRRGVSYVGECRYQSLASSSGTIWISFHRRSTGAFKRAIFAIQTVTIIWSVERG